MEMPPLYIFCGIGVALSLFGFLIKKLKNEVDDLRSQLRKDEITIAKHEERLTYLSKVLEDRRHDIQELYKKLK